MVRKIIYISIFAFLLQTGSINAGSTESEELKGSNSQSAVGDALKISVELCLSLITIWTG